MTRLHELSAAVIIGQIIPDEHIGRTKPSGCKLCNEPEGTNKECERCRLIAEIEKLEAEVMRLRGIITDVAESGIERTSQDKYHCVQISLNLWEEICGDVTDGAEADYVSAEEPKREITWCNICFDFVCTCQATQQKRIDAMEREDYLERHSEG